MEYFNHKEDINVVGNFLIATDEEAGPRPIFMNSHCGLLKIRLA